MEEIKIYLAVIDPQLLNNLSGKAGEFIRLFKKQKPESEEAFIKEICGKKHNKNYYRTVKSRTKKILQALVIISTPKGENIVKKKYDFCQRNFLIGQKFLNKGERKEGIRLIKLAWQVAVDYDFVYMACELSSILFHDHVYYSKNKRKANYYSRLVDKYLASYTAEKQAEKYFFQIVGQISKSVSPEVLKYGIDQINKQKGTSVKFQVYQTTLNILYGFDTRNYELVIQSCNQALQFFKNKRGVYNSHYQFFWSKRGIALMNIGQYQEATISFEKAHQYAQPKSYNDYLIRLYKTLNALQAGEYETAYQLYLENRRCRITSIHQQFVIIEAYLCFLAKAGYLQLKSPFRLGKYLNETFRAQTDKQGDNVNIIIAELLVLLARDQGKFIDRIEAVKHYTYRHLKSEETRRAKWFIKILCLIPNVNFHSTALDRRAKRYIDLLKKHPIHLGENFTIEIIPFEDLLRMIMQQLDRKVA